MIIWSHQNPNANPKVAMTHGVKSGVWGDFVQKSADTVGVIE